MNEIDDPTTMPFFEELGKGVLRLQLCVACGHLQLIPRPFCLCCDSEDLTWTPSSGLGTIYTFTIVRLLVREDCPPPYVIALVDLEEGPRVLGMIKGLSCKIGDPVTLCQPADHGSAIVFQGL